MDNFTATEIAYKSGYKSGYEQGMKDAADTNVGCKWISVKERLPEDKKDEYVLVVCDYHGKISVETRKKWNIDSSVTHWMPLPEPPKEIGYA